MFHYNEAKQLADHTFKLLSIHLSKVSPHAVKITLIHRFHPDIQFIYKSKNLIFFFYLIKIHSIQG